MGALSYTLAGMGAGLGEGIARVGERMGQEANREEQMRWQMERDRQNQQNMLDRQRELLELKSELGQIKNGAGKGSGSAAIDPQSDQARGLMVALSRGAISDAQARDAQAMWRGETPTVTTTKDLQGPPDEAGNGPGSAQVTSAKYGAGESRALLDRATAALERAMMGSNMGDSDKYAKALTETDKRGYANDFVQTGNAQSARGALLMEGKDLASGNGTDVVTGAAKAGSVAQSDITKNRAQAGAASAQAGLDRERTVSERGKRERTTPESIKEDLNILEGERKKLATELADIRKREEEAGKTSAGRRDLLPKIQEERAAIMERSRSIDQKYTEVATRLQTIREGKSGASAPPAPPAAKRTLRFDRNGNMIK